MATIAKVAKNSFLYSISSILLRASSIIFFPLFSYYLTKVDYGILSMTQSIASIVTIFAGFELSRSLTRIIFNKESDGTNEDTILYTTLICSTVLSVSVVGTLLLFGKFLLKPMLEDIPFYPYVYYYLLSIPFSVVIENCRAYLRAKHQGEKVFILDILFYGTNILLNLVFVVLLKMKILGIILGVLVNAVLFSITLIPFFYRKHTFSFSKKVALHAFRYSYVLMPSVFAGILLESIDRFFLNSHSGSGSSGTYYISLTFASIFSSIKESVIVAYTPWTFQNIQKKSESEIAEITAYIFGATGLLALAISWFSKEALQILSSNPELVEAYQYIPLNIAAIYVIFLGQLYGLKILYYENTIKYLVFTVVVGIVFDLVFCYFLVPIYDIQGASLSRYFSFLLHVYAIFILSRLDKQKNKMYNDQLLFVTLFSMSALITLPLMDNNTIEFLTLKIVLFTIICATAIFFINKKYKLLNYWHHLRLK